MTEDNGNIRSFDTGATRDTSTGKLDYEGFLSPAVLKQYARFMNMNRLQSDGKLRDSDNWQKGIPLDVYMKSGYRHFFEWWEDHRVGVVHDGISRMAAMCGLLFNVMGYMHEYLQSHDEVRFDDDEPTPEMEARKKKIKEEKHPAKVAAYGADYKYGNHLSITVSEDAKILKGMDAELALDNWGASIVAAKKVEDKAAVTGPHGPMVWVEEDHPDVSDEEYDKLMYDMCPDCGCAPHCRCTAEDLEADLARNNPGDFDTKQENDDGYPEPPPMYQGCIGCKGERLDGNEEPCNRCMRNGTIAFRSMAGDMYDR